MTTIQPKSQAIETVFSAHWPDRLVFGPGQLQTLGEHSRHLGKRAFLVTMPELSALGLTDRLRRLLEQAGLEVGVYDAVRPDPACEDVDQAAVQARAAGADMVIGLGGGSAIDFAKAVAVAATHPGSIWEYVTYTGANAQPVTPAVLPVIAVPTTAGTGSEVSQGAVLDHPRLGMKAALLNPLIIPRVALVDPELTYSMPARTTAMTGLDAMTHGIESFLNVVRRNYMSDLFALEAVQRVAANLPRVLDNPQDYPARSQMSWAATAGGMSIALANASVAHAMALPAGARLHLPHGLLLSRLQPVVLAHTWEAQPERCALLAEAAGAAHPAMNQAERARALAPWLTDFVQRIGLAGAWTPPPIDASTLEALTRDVFAYMGRPLSQYEPRFTQTQVRDMFTEAFS